METEYDQNQGCDREGSLMTATLDLLKKDSRSLLQIYDETGVPFYWLRRFVTGGYKNPSVNRVQYLFEKLSGKKLNVN